MSRIPADNRADNTANYMKICGRRKVDEEMRDEETLEEDSTGYRHRAGLFHFNGRNFLYLQLVGLAAAPPTLCLATPTFGRFGCFLALTGADPRGVTWVMTPPLGPGAPPAYQGHHRPSRGPRPSRGTTEPPRYTTYLSEPPQACQEHHRPSRGTSQRPVQRHHGPARDITRLSGAPQYRSSWLYFSLAVPLHSHGIIATAAHIRAKIRTASRQPVYDFSMKIICSFLHYIH